MEGSCACDVYLDDCEMLEDFELHDVRARYGHRCYDCGDVIPPGTVYSYATGREYDGAYWGYKQCPPCAAIQRDYGCVWGDLVEQIWECLGVNYVTGRTVDDEEDDT